MNRKKASTICFTRASVRRVYAEMDRLRGEMTKINDLNIALERRNRVIETHLKRLVWALTEPIT